MSYMSDAINKLYLKTEELKNDLLELSRVIHSNPEIKWKEYNERNYIQTYILKLQYIHQFQKVILTNILFLKMVIDVII